MLSPVIIIAAVPTAQAPTVELGDLQEHEAVATGFTDALARSWIISGIVNGPMASIVIEEPSRRSIIQGDLRPHFIDPVSENKRSLR